jgi:hypothetical protein
VSERTSRFWVWPLVGLAVIVGGGYGIVTYTEGQGDRFVASALAEAEKDGWLRPQGTPNIRAQFPGPTFQQKLKPALDIASRWSLEVQQVNWESSLRSERILDDASRALDILRPIRAEIETTVSKTSDMHSDTMALARLFLLRGISRARAQDAAGARESFEFATALTPVSVSQDWTERPWKMGLEIRKGWCEAFVADPSGLSLADPAVRIVSHVRAKIFEQISHDYWQANIDNQEHRRYAPNRRYQFELLQQGNRFFKELESNPKDLAATWGLLQRTSSEPEYGAINGELISGARDVAPLVASYQLMNLFQESLRNGGRPPAGLAKSVDTDNYGKPLKFKGKTNGFLIYSVGQDHVDSGGGSGDPGIKLEGNRVIWTQ